MMWCLNNYKGQDSRVCIPTGWPRRLCSLPGKGKKSFSLPYRPYRPYHRLWADCLDLGSSNFFSLRSTLTPPVSPKGQDLASSSYQHTVVLNYAQIFVLRLASEWDIYGAGRGGKLRSVRKFSWYLRASVKGTRNIWLLFCMIYLHCKFYNVIKINDGGPDTGHVRPASTACNGDSFTYFFTYHPYRLRSPRRRRFFPCV
jgi:hypothetical protein